MRMITNGLIGLVAILHLWFMILEMFLWRKPLGRKTFKQTVAQADASATMAANQGLYNGFLVAGLLWGLLTSDAAHALSIKVFFLSCIAVAGIFGAVTAIPQIFFIQALPAIVALALLLI